MTQDRIVSAQAIDEDSRFDLNLRPKYLADFIGQAKLKENLAIAVEAGEVEVKTEHQSKLFQGGSLLGRALSSELSVTVAIEAGQDHYVRATLDENSGLGTYHLRLLVVDEATGAEAVRLLRRSGE